MMFHRCPDCGASLGIGDWPFPCGGKGHFAGSFWRGDAQVHSSEKVVVYQDAQGHIRIPGRGDRPIHPKLAAAGYERRVLDTVQEVRQVEKATGYIHEDSNYSANSAMKDRDTGSS
jgi:hypothetical protein